MVGNSIANERIPISGSWKAIDIMLGAAIKLWLINPKKTKSTTKTPSKINVWLSFRWFLNLLNNDV
jgi:hypothetical protein